MSCTANRFDAARYWKDRLAGGLTLADIGYKGLGLAYNTWLYRVRRSVFLRVAGRLPCEWRRASVLDVGSGSGFYVSIMRELGVPALVGTDITERSIEYLRQRYAGYSFVQCDIGAASPDLPGGPFDIITAMDVLFHIVDDQAYERAFTNVAAHLDSGGFFIFTEPGPGHTVQTAPHSKCRSESLVLHAMSRAGMEPVAHMPVFEIMNEPVGPINKLRQCIWSGIQRIVSRGERWGFWLGAALFPVELMLLSACDSGPSTNIFVCRKAKVG